MGKQNNITYLIGAGASCNALPLARDFKKQHISNPLIEFIKWLEDPPRFSDANDEKLNSQLIDETKQVRDNSMSHDTIDTYAKKLYITAGGNNFDEKLLMLKRVLSVYFIYRQFSQPVDIRYDTFFAAITGLDEKKKPKLPERIKIISWNYDFQFEKGFIPYIPGADAISTTHYYLNPYPKNDGRTDLKIDFTRFGIVRLNGIAGFYSKDEHIRHILPSFNVDKSNFKSRILEIYKQHLSTPNNLSNLFCFAWEGNHIAENAVENAIEIAKNTEVLIIIGYSFPFFNREIDKKILNAMQPSKAYYQVPEEDYDKYINRLQGILQYPLKGIDDKEDDVGSARYYFPKPKPIGDKDQFFIPYEL